MIRFAKPLLPGDLVAVTAPSSGVNGSSTARLDLVLNHLRALGYRVVEGQCLRSQYKDASASAADRAGELNRFLRDPEVAAIFPPWGGELASELLEYIDFVELRGMAPKWLLGFSDISTLHMPLTLISGWATAHGSNMMDLAPTQTDLLTTSVLSVLAHNFETPVQQKASPIFQKQWIDFAIQPDGPLNLTERTEWKRLDGSVDRIEFSGRLIGGCLDTVAWLAGTQYGDVPAFVRQHGKDGVIFYFENAEMAPPGLVRALLALKRRGWFDGLAGLLIGRSAGPMPTTESSLRYPEALRAVLGDLPMPVVFDVDIGHQPPQFTLINGAMAHVVFNNGSGSIAQMR